MYSATNDTPSSIMLITYNEWCQLILSRVLCSMKIEIVCLWCITWRNIRLIINVLRNQRRISNQYNVLSIRHQWKYYERLAITLFPDESEPHIIIYFRKNKLNINNKNTQSFLKMDVWAENTDDVAE